MSLYVYSGVPGSGKTYHAVRDMRFNKSPCITNVNVKGLSNVAVLPLDKITPRLLMAYSEYYYDGKPARENELLFVLDECQLLFNSRSWADKGDEGMNNSRMDWLAFLSQHRKYGYRCIFIAQSIEMIDKQFRCLCEFDCRHTAAGSVSLLTRAAAVLGLRFTCAKYFNFDSDVLVFRDIYRISKRTFKFYNTFQDIIAPDFSDVDLAPLLSQLGGGGACPTAVGATVPPSCESKEACLSSDC